MTLINFLLAENIELYPMSKSNHSGNAVYGLGFIGAVIYYISIATSFWTGFVGFLKAIVWPAFLVYEALKFLNGG